MSKFNTFETGKARMPKLKPSEKFGMWEVIEWVGSVKRGTHNRTNRTVYKFRCACGTEKDLLGTDVYRQRIKSCGCTWDCGPEESAFRATRLTYRGNAKSRGLDFVLTDFELKGLFSSDCHYCGEPPSNVTKKARVGDAAIFKYSGIDRSDNTIGYISGNCVSCCRTCNWMKQRMSPQEFIAHCRRVVERAEMKSRRTLRIFHKNFIFWG
jgi:hypothetical protein